MVDVGPQAGTAGGRIVFEGSYGDLVRADTLTARHLQHALPISARFGTGWAVAHQERA